RPASRGSPADHRTHECPAHGHGTGRDLLVFLDATESGVWRTDTELSVGSRRGNLLSGGELVATESAFSRCASDLLGAIWAHLEIGIGTGLSRMFARCATALLAEHERQDSRHDGCADLQYFIRDFGGVTHNMQHGSPLLTRLDHEMSPRRKP